MIKLVSPSDITRPEVDALWSRADEIAQGASPNLSGTRVTLALFNTPFPLPLNPERILQQAGAETHALHSPEQIKNVTDGVLLFSHPETGAAGKYAEQTPASFLNAGDGTNENPVRALIDAYAIRSLKGDLSALRVAILGNLKFSAEAHSLARLLGMYGARLSLVTPAALSMPYDLTDDVRLTAYEVEETNDLPTTLRKTDALYLANIDSIRVDKKIFDKLKTFYTSDSVMLSEAKEGLVILGEWDGAESLLVPTRAVVEQSARAVLLALVESK